MFKGKDITVLLLDAGVLLGFVAVWLQSDFMIAVKIALWFAIAISLVVGFHSCARTTLDAHLALFTRDRSDKTQE